MPITDFRELATYRLAAELRREVFRLSRRWPAYERHALTNQARRSSRSIGANVAEAWAKRRFPRHFVAKLSDSLGELNETSVWIEVAEECGYVAAEDAARLALVSRQVGSGLVRMMRRPEQWCGPASLTGRGAGA